MSRKLQFFKYKRILFGLVILSGMILLSSCNQKSDAEPTIDPNALMTQVVNTIQAEMTQTEAAKPTMTATTPPTLTVTPTKGVTATLNIPLGIPTQNQPASNPGVNTGCNQASFLSDVTIPDGTVINPGAAFTKTWSFTNIGTCNWTTGYKLIYYSGTKMGGPDSQQLTDVVIAPNSTVNVSVDLTAPTETGTYTGYWAFQNELGETFGIGSVAQPFYVQIKVETSATATSVPENTATPTPTTETPEP